MLWHFIFVFLVLVTKHFFKIVTTRAWVYWKLPKSKRCWHVNDNNNLNHQVETLLLELRVRVHWSSLEWFQKLKSLRSRHCLVCLFYCWMTFGDNDNLATWWLFYSFVWTHHFVLNKCGTLSCEIAFCPVLASPPFAAVPTGSKCWFRLPLSENLLPLNHTRVSRWQGFFFSPES